MNSFSFLSFTSRWTVIIFYLFLPVYLASSSFLTFLNDITTFFHVEKYEDEKNSAGFGG
jgi:hypothetical protein